MKTDATDKYITCSKRSTHLKKKSCNSCLNCSNKEMKKANMTDKVD